MSQPDTGPGQLDDNATIVWRGFAEADIGLAHLFFHIDRFETKPATPQVGLRVSHQLENERVVPTLEHDTAVRAVKDAKGVVSIFLTLCPKGGLGDCPSSTLTRRSRLRSVVRQPGKWLPQQMNIVRSIQGRTCAERMGKVIWHHGLTALSGHGISR